MRRNNHSCLLDAVLMKHCYLKSKMLYFILNCRHFSKNLSKITVAFITDGIVNHENDVYLQRTASSKMANRPLNLAIAVRSDA